MKHLSLLTTAFLVPWLIFFSFGTTLGGVDSQILKQINARLEKTSSPEKKAKLCLYRARYLVKTKQFAKAMADYDTAMALDHNSWIHLERARLYLLLGNYDYAHSDAFAAKAENSELSDEADPIINNAAKELKKINNMKNPQEIVLDRNVTPYRKSRFDIARELGLDRSVQENFADWSRKQKAEQKQTAAKVTGSSGSNCKTVKKKKS